MKPLPGIGTAVCLFGLGTLLAWLTGAPAPAPPAPASPHSSLTSAFTSSSPSSEAEALVARTQRELIYGPDPDPVTGTFDSAGLERMISSCRGFVGELEAVESYFEEWAQRDFPAALAWLDRRGIAQPIIGDSTGMLRTTRLFSLWADEDLEAALAAAPRLTFEGRRAQAVFTTLMKLASADPDRARLLFTQHLELFTSECGLFGPEGYGDGKTGAFDFLSSLPPGGARGHLLAELMTSLFTSAETKVNQWNNAPDDVKRDLIAAGFLERTARDGLKSSDEASAPVFAGMEELARRHAETTGNAAAADEFISHHGPAWAARDLAAAFAWARRHLKGEARLHLSAGLFKAAAAADFDHAALTWQTLPEGILKAKAAGALLNGAPGDRKPQAQALLDTLSAHDRAISGSEVLPTGSPAP